MRFNPNVIFFKVAGYNKISDIYINHDNCFGDNMLC